MHAVCVCVMFVSILCSYVSQYYSTLSSSYYSVEVESYSLINPNTSDAPTSSVDQKMAPWLSDAVTLAKLYTPSNLRLVQ